MGAKVIKHPRSKRFNQRRRRSSVGPEGRNRSGYVGQDATAEKGDVVEVYCEPGGKKKKKFPWGTVLMTGIVTAVGSLVVFKTYEKIAGGSAKTPNPENSSQQAVLNARDMLLLASPGAERYVHNPVPQPQQPQQTGIPAEHMMALMEENARLQADMAQLQGFLAAEEAHKAAEKDRLAALMGEDDD